MKRAPFEFDGVVRLTSIGTGFLLVTLFVVGFAALNTGNNSLYIALAFMLGVLILSGLASKGGLKKLQVEFLGFDEAWAGQNTIGRLRLTNRSRIWNVRDVILVMNEMEKPWLVPVVARRSTVEIEALFLFSRRGRVAFTTVDLYTRYPFALFLKKRRLRLKGEGIVYPRLLDQAPPRNAASAIHGETASTRRLGTGSDLFGFREYVKGDSLRQVHWKKSASLGRWIMKQTELDANRSLRFAIDPHLPSEARREEFETMISTATTCLRDALASELDVVLYLPGAALRGRGAGARRAILEAVALLEPATESEPLTTDEGTMVFRLRRLDEARSA